MEKAVIAAFFEVPCLMKGTCQMTKFTCGLDEISTSFKLTFSLTQTTELSNSNILKESADFIIARVNLWSFSVTSDNKRKRSTEHIINKRSTTITFTPHTVTYDEQVSTCPSLTYLEENMCGELIAILYQFRYKYQY